jgi:hypothetical protein
MPANGFVRATFFYFGASNKSPLLGPALASLGPATGVALVTVSAAGSSLRAGAAVDAVIGFAGRGAGAGMVATAATGAAGAVAAAAAAAGAAMAAAPAAGVPIAADAVADGAGIAATMLGAGSAATGGATGFAGSGCAAAAGPDRAGVRSAPMTASVMPAATAPIVISRLGVNSGAAGSSSGAHERVSPDIDERGGAAFELGRLDRCSGAGIGGVSGSGVATGARNGGGTEVRSGGGCGVATRGATNSSVSVRAACGLMVVTSSCTDSPAMGGSSTTGSGSVVVRARGLWLAAGTTGGGGSGMRLWPLGGNFDVRLPSRTMRSIEMAVSGDEKFLRATASSARLE